MTRRTKGTGSISKLPNGSFRVKVPCGKTEKGATRYVTRNAKTKSEASELQKKLIADIANRQIMPGPRVTFRKFAEQLLFEPLNGVSDRTRDGYLRQLRKHVFPRIGSKVLSDIRVVDVERVLNEVRKSLAAGTTNNVRIGMSKVFNEAVRLELRFDNPMARTKKARRLQFEPTNVQAPLTREELQAFVAAAKSEELGALLTLLALTGMRLGEALGLKWEDVSLEHQILFINRTLTRESYLMPDGRSGTRIAEHPPKTKESRRSVRLVPDVIQMLEFQRVRQSLVQREDTEVWNEGDWVFTNKNGKAMDPNNVRRSYKNFLKRNNLRFVRLHDLRHTFATVLIENDSASLPDVSRALGHSSIAVTLGTYGSTAKISDRAFADIGKLVQPDSEAEVVFVSADYVRVAGQTKKAPWH
jgi:integrase